jgi:hypothetical protein
MSTSNDLVPRGSFVFAPRGSQAVHTVARVHLRRLWDVLHVSIARGDAPRARRAWAILARCAEADWQALWRTALHVADLEIARAGYEMQDVRVLDTLLQKPTGEVAPPALRPAGTRANAAAG